MEAKIEKEQLKTSVPIFDETSAMQLIMSKLVF